MLLNGGKSNLPDELKIAVVCEKMGWSYNEYNEQPNWFIETLLLKWRSENEVNEQQQKRYGAKQ